MARKRLRKDPEVDSYIAALEPATAQAVERLREVLLSKLPEGFEEQMDSMPSYVVPLTRYPAGYHVKANTPLPYMGIAAQKSGISLHHFGLYVDKSLLAWFTEEYARHSSHRLDMGKSCIRFKKIEQIPFELIGKLAAKRSAKQWIASYERARSG